MEEQLQTHQNDTVETSNTAVQPTPEALEQLAQLLKSNPKIQEELWNKIKTAPTPSNPPAAPNTIVPPISPPVGSTPQPIQFDVINAPLEEFVNYKGNNTDYEIELKTHLMTRHPEINGKIADSIVDEAKRRMMSEYAITKQLPLDPAKTVRTNTILIMQELAEEQQSQETTRIQKAAEHFLVAEKEFGSNYVHAKKVEADKFIAEQLGIPKEELAFFSAERYKKLLTSYNQRNMSVQDISQAEKESNEINDILKKRAKMLGI